MHLEILTGGAWNRTDYLLTYLLTYSLTLSMVQDII